MPLVTLQARYAAALVELYDQGAIAQGQQPRPGQQPQHVFDFPDGLRLIVSRERSPDGQTGVHLSGSLIPGTTLYQRLAQTDEVVNEFCTIICARWQELANSTRTPGLVALSDDEGVPHFMVWDPH
jgi:hypothetical protein